MVDREDVRYLGSARLGAPDVRTGGRNPRHGGTDAGADVVQIGERRSE